MTSHRSYGRTKIPPSVIAKKRKRYGGGNHVLNFFILFFFPLATRRTRRGKMSPPCACVRRPLGRATGWGETQSIYIYRLSLCSLRPLLLLLLPPEILLLLARHRSPRAPRSHDEKSRRSRRLF